MRSPSRTIVALLLAATALPGLPPAEAAHRPAAPPPDFLDLACDEREAGEAARALETSFRFGNCGGHVGMQTWYLGDRGVFTLRGGDYRLLVNEALFNGPPQQEVTIEASLDGLAWGTVLLVPFTAQQGMVAIPPNATTHEVLPLPAYPEPFRFLRVRLDDAPDGGQAGFLDAAYLGLIVDRVDPAAVPPLPYAARTTFGCAADILEDLDPAHPCWFGDDDGAPLGRIQGFPEPLSDKGWFSPASYHHTYPLGQRVLTRIEGHAAVAPYRLGDHPFCGAFAPTVPGSVLAKANAAADSAVGVALTTVHVQTSVDGRHWQTAGTFEAPHSVPLDEDTLGLGPVPVPVDFAFDLPSRPASFARIIAQMSPTSSLSGACERHEGYLLDSALTIATP